MNKDDFLGLLINTGCLRFGEFTLKSGISSPFFVNLGEISSGKSLSQLGEALADIIHKKFAEVTTLFGPAYKGIPMATATAQAYLRLFNTDLHVFYDRKEKKEHGEGGNFIGYAPTERDQIIIVDDVYTSGGTKLEAAQSINNSFGIKPSGIIVAVDRRKKGQPIDPAMPPMASIISLADMCDYLEQNDSPHTTRMKAFYEDL